MTFLFLTLMETFKLTRFQLHCNILCFLDWKWCFYI